MKTVRMHTFETNSSSTHSISIVSAEDFAKFEAGDMLFDNIGDLVPTEQVMKEYAEEFDDFPKDLSIDDFKFVLTHINLAKNYCNFQHKKYGLTEFVDQLAEHPALTDDVLSSIVHAYNAFDYVSYDRYFNDYDDELIWFKKQKKINGTDVVAFGKYGTTM